MHTFICVFFHLYNSVFPRIDTFKILGQKTSQFCHWPLWYLARFLDHNRFNRSTRTNMRKADDTNDLSSRNGRVLETMRKLPQIWQNFLTLKFEAIYPWSFYPILSPGPWCSGSFGWSILFFCAFPFEAHPGGIWREANNQWGRWGLWKVPQAIPTNWDVSMGPGWPVTNVQPHCS